MNKLTIALLVSSVMAIGTAQANFTGFGAGLGGGVTYNSHQLDEKSHTESTKVKKHKTEGHVYLDLNYTLPVYQDFLMGVGATYNFNSVKGDVTDEATFKIKDHYSVYVTPGYLVTPDLFAYGKLAYHRAKMEFQKPSTDYNSNGFGIGAGLSYALTSNLELGGEVQYIMFGKKDYKRTDTHVKEGKSKVKPTEFSLTAKYRF